MKRSVVLLTVAFVCSLIFVGSHVFSHTPCVSDKNTLDSAEAWHDSAVETVEYLEAEIFKKKYRFFNPAVILWHHERVKLAREIDELQQKLKKADDALELAETRLENARDAYRTCYNREYRTCGCEVRHTQLPADPCEGFGCDCTRSRSWAIGPCNCPSRAANSAPGCGSGSGSSGG